MIESEFAKEFISTNSSKECYICHYWYFLDKELSLNFISAMGVMMY